jgi:hypothetical protein
VIEPSDIAATLDATPRVLEQLLDTVDADLLSTRPEPGEWCVLEVIAHLVATDADAFRARIASIIAGEPEIVPFDPWAAINARDVAALDLGDLLAELRTEREASTAFLESIRPSDLAATARYGRHGTFAAGDFVHEWPHHDHEHLQQILDILKRSYLPHMGETMRQALTPPPS